VHNLGITTAADQQQTSSTTPALQRFPATNTRQPAACLTTRASVPPCRPTILHPAIFVTLSDLPPPVLLLLLTASQSLMLCSLRRKHLAASRQQWQSDTQQQ
jgi:hypothetical protein